MKVIRYHTSLKDTLPSAAGEKKNVVVSVEIQEFSTLHTQRPLNILKVSKRTTPLCKS